MNTTQYNHLWILLREAHKRSKDSTCDLETDEIEALMEVLEWSFISF